MCVILKDKLIKMGHTDPDKGAKTVKEELEACRKNIEDKLGRIGVHGEEAKTRAKSICERDLKELHGGIKF